MKLLRKLCVVGILCLCCFGLVACSDDKKSKDIDDILYTNVKLNITDPLFVGDFYDIEKYLTFSSNIDQITYQCLSMDTNILEFVDAKTFKCKAQGTVTIRVRTPIKDGMFVTANQNVEVEDRPSYFSSFSFALKEVYASYSGVANKRIAQNIATMLGESSFPLLVECSTDLAKYDPYTGTITYIDATGNCEITVRVPYDRNANKEVLYHNYSFNFYVDRYVKDISLTGGASSFALKVGERGTFKLNINDGAGCTCPKPTISFLSDSMLSVDENYNYVVLSSGSSEGKGKTVMTVTYYTAHGVTAEKKYTVTILDVPTALNCTLYSGDSLATSQLNSNTKYKLKIKGVFDEGVNNAYLDKSNLSVYSISDCTLVKNGNDIDLTFTTPLSAGSYQIILNYYKKTYGDSIQLNYTLNYVVTE